MVWQRLKVSIGKKCKTSTRTSVNSPHCTSYPHLEIHTKCVNIAQLIWSNWVSCIPRGVMCWRETMSLSQASIEYVNLPGIRLLPVWQQGHNFAKNIWAPNMHIRVCGAYHFQKMRIMAHVCFNQIMALVHCDSFAKCLTKSSSKQLWWWHGWQL
jgi:hypothetical protein